MRPTTKSTDDASLTQRSEQTTTNLKPPASAQPAPAQPRLTRAEKAEVIRQLKQGGATQREIADQLQIDRTTVYRILRQQDGPSRRSREGGPTRLTTRQLRMLRYAIHDRVPSEAFWTRGTRQAFSRDDRLAYSAGHWTTGLIRALVEARYPATAEAALADDAFRKFIRTGLQMDLTGHNWLPIRDRTSD